MAYHAIISLKQTLACFLNCIHISLLSPSDHETLEYACNEVNSIRDGLVCMDEYPLGRAAEKYLEEVKEAAWKLEDAIETHVSVQLLSQSDESLGDESNSLEISQVIKALYSFKETMENIERYNGDEEEEERGDEDDNDVSSITDFAGNKSKNVIGLSNTFFNELKAQLLQSDESERNNFTIVGMAGIGKTTVAMKILEDPSIRKYFEHCVFVTIGQKYQARRVMLHILAQLNNSINPDLQMQSDEELLASLGTKLKGMSVLVVLDDLWDPKHLIHFQSIVDWKGKVKTVITTRLVHIAVVCASRHGIYHMRLLNDGESWDLLRQEVFGEPKVCPYELEKAGKKIAEICDGLPLTIVIVAHLLSKADKTPEYWNQVAEKKNFLFTDAYNEIFKVLLPSYRFLPLYSKTCFLYMGVFPLNYDIPVSKLIKLWMVEGLIWKESVIGQLERFSRRDCLTALIFCNVIQIRQLNSYTDEFKSCSLHSVFWHFCIKQAATENFFRFINGRPPNTIAEDIQIDRRLSIHKNILFSIKEVCNSVESSSTVRSLLCTGPNHEYPLPISFGRLRLLRVLNALTIRFYDFPMELLKLLELRYLALTCNRKLPTFISKLLNLEYLIVHPHMSIKYSGSPSFLPMEIWDMKELKHLEVMGSDLPEPDPNSGDDALLPNLFRILGVSHHSCIKGILKRIPNLTKLGIQIELSPENVETLCCFDHLSYLHELIKSLKCVIMNPNNPMSSSQVVSFPASLPIFPSSLEKLSLSGSGYPWECMKIIAELPNLKGLKLHGYAFQGHKWKINEGEFKTLCSLLIEDTDLVHLIVDDACLGNLLRLTIRHCYKLKEIPLIQKRHDLHILEIVDCPSAVASTKQLQEKQLELGNDIVQVYVHSSWNDAAPKKPPPIDITSCKWIWD